MSPAGETHHPHAGAYGGANTRSTVLDHEAFLDRAAHAAGCIDEHVGRQLAVMYGRPLTISRAKRSNNPLTANRARVLQGTA